MYNSQNQTTYTLAIAEQFLFLMVYEIFIDKIYDQR